MGLLGNGENEAWLAMKGGQVLIAKIDDPSVLDWGRVMNDVSQTTVEVSTGQHGDCCSIYGKIGTWGHEVVVFRDGKRCWEGPITNIKWKRGGVSIIAQDVLAWSKRASASARAYPTPVFVVDQGWLEVQRTTDINNPNILANATLLGAGTGPTLTRDVKARAGTPYDQLVDMTKSGLMFTAVGRRVIVWHAGLIMGKTATLLQDHLSGEIEIEEDGMDLTTQPIFINDAGVEGFVLGTDSFYGTHETVVSSDGVTTASLSAEAATYKEAHFPAPLSVNVPQGSVLSCDAPFSMEELVAGAIVPVKVEGTCRTVTATQQLDSVQVSSGGETGEMVSITVTPASGLVTP